jgi:hypothetical protein
VFFGGTAGGNVMTVGGAADATMVGGGSGDLLQASGTGTVILTASAGSQTLLGSAKGGTDIFFGGAATAGGTGQVMRGGAGLNLFTAGVGNMTLIGGGTTDLFAFAAGARSVTTIQQFDPARDFVKVNGYDDVRGRAALAAMTDVTAAGTTSAVMTLSDATQITFVGVTKSSLSAANFL